MVLAMSMDMKHTVLLDETLFKIQVRLDQEEESAMSGKKTSHGANKDHRQKGEEE